VEAYGSLLIWKPLIQIILSSQYGPNFLDAFGIAVLQFPKNCFAVGNPISLLLMYQKPYVPPYKLFLTHQ